MPFWASFDPIFQKKLLPRKTTEIFFGPNCISLDPLGDPQPGWELLAGKKVLASWTTPGEGPSSLRKWGGGLIFWICSGPKKTSGSQKHAKKTDLRRFAPCANWDKFDSELFLGLKNVKKKTTVRILGDFTRNSYQSRRFTQTEGSQIWGRGSDLWIPSVGPGGFFVLRGI